MLSTRITRLFGVSHPIVQGGMRGIAKADDDGVRLRAAWASSLLTLTGLRKPAQGNRADTGTD